MVILTYIKGLWINYDGTSVPKISFEACKMLTGPSYDFSDAQKYLLRLMKKT